MNRMYMYQSQSPNSSPAFSLSIHLFLLYICVSISVLQIGSVQFSSVAQSCLSLCDPMDCSMPGFPVHHQLLELAQTHVHRVCDAIQPSHLLSSCLQSFPASESFPRSQFFASGGQSIGVSASASVLPMNIQDWFPLRLTGLISLQSKGLSKSSPIPRFKSISSLVLSFLYGPALISVHGYWIALTRWIFVGKVMSLLANMLSRLQIRSAILFF